MNESHLNTIKVFQLCIAEQRKKIWTFWLFSSSETETLQQLLHAPSCCLLALSLFTTEAQSPPAAPSLSLSLSVFVYVARPLSSHRLSCWGEQREGGASWASAHRLSICINPPSLPLYEPLPWRLSRRFFFLKPDLTLSSVYFGFSATRSNFLLIFSSWFFHVCFKLSIN